MGKSNNLIKEFYDLNDVCSKGKTALLGFTNNNWYFGDLYDIQLKNWDINSKWKLKEKYNTIICTRTAFFAQSPVDFITRCYDNLKDKGTLVVDWGVGAHFYNAKNEISLGWIKNNSSIHVNYKETESSPSSCLWDISFEDNFEVQVFIQKMKKFGYSDSITKDVLKEIPVILKLEDINPFFNYNISFKTLWEDTPQLYILFIGSKI